MKAVPAFIIPSHIKARKTNTKIHTKISKALLTPASAVSGHRVAAYPQT